MKAFNDCPVDLDDLSDLHIRRGHYHTSPTDINIDRLIVDLSESSMPALFTGGAGDHSLAFSCDVDTWYSQSQPTASRDCASFTHDELIHQLGGDGGVFDPVNSTDLLLDPGHGSPKKHRSSQSYPVSGSHTPTGFTNAGSLSTSPEISSILNSFLGKRDSDRTQRRISIDSGSEKKEQKVPRHKRPSHIRAETKRRGKIQECFGQLAQLVPMVIDSDPKAANAMSRKTKAAVLSQTADYCRRLCVENKSLEAEVQTLCAETQALTADINLYQNVLPAEGIDQKTFRKTSVSADAMFRNYVNARSLANWKFWIFSQLLQSLFNSYNSSVSTSCSEDFLRTVSVWVNDRLSLVALRPVVFNSLLNICTRSSVVKDNQISPQEIQTTVLIDSGLVTVNSLPVRSS